MKAALLWVLALGCVANVACGDDGDGADEEGDSSELGPATGAVCDSTLTYEKDIAPLMTQYCVRCHATTVKGTARMGAPDDHNFDTEKGILDEKDHVDRTAGSGPNATNTFMPFNPPDPTTDQRAIISKWLACQN